MKKRGIKPQDTGSDKHPKMTRQDQPIRKNMMTATLKNATILSVPWTTPVEKAQAKAMLTQFAPALAAIGMHEHVTWKNSVIQDIMQTAVEPLKSSLTQENSQGFDPDFECG